MKTIVFISDIQIGPWIVPQKVQTTFASAYLKDKNLIASFIFSIPNSENLINLPDLKKFEAIVFFSRWQLPFISDHLENYIKEFEPSSKKIYFALEDVDCELNSDSIKEQLRIFQFFASMIEFKS